MCVVVIFSPFSNAVIPSARIEIYSPITTSEISYNMYGGVANFGPDLHFGKPLPSSDVPGFPTRLSLPPSDDELLCNEFLGLADYTEDKKSLSGMIALVPRGVCSFPAKVLSAQNLGATGVIIYDTLASRYGYFDGGYDTSSTSDNIQWPQDKMDYECSNGEAWVSNDEISLYVFSHNQSVYDGDHCVFLSEDTNGALNEAQCESKRCLLTGEGRGRENMVSMRVCCAWDIHLNMDRDQLDSTGGSDVIISSTFITMNQGNLLLELLRSNSTQADIGVIVYERFYPQLNASLLFLWLLGTFITLFASWLSASDHRDVEKQVRDALVNDHSPQIIANVPALSPSSVLTTILCTEEGQIELTTTNKQDNGVEDTRPIISIIARESEGSNSDRVEAQNNVSPHSTVEYIQNRTPQSDRIIELQIVHVVVFVMVASAALFIILFLRLYTVARMLYTIAGSIALAKIGLLPLFRRLARKIGLQAFEAPMCKRCVRCGYDKLTWLDLLSLVSGFSVGITWLRFGFSNIDAEIYFFYWITQDIMGISICIKALKNIQLNKIQVATVLLVIVFVYDILFVFITPFIFKEESITMAVAMNGSAPVDPDFCEKYPFDNKCRYGDDQMPMLLRLPRINDYRGGMSSLRLVDMLLPGLLLSFAARLDVSTRFSTFMEAYMREGPGLHHHQQSSTKHKQYFGGNFIWLTIAYSGGLLVAYIITYLIKIRQPALLYVVPSCLGTIFILGWKRGNTSMLWTGPTELITLQQVMYLRERVPIGSIDWNTVFPQNSDGTDSESDD